MKNFDEILKENDIRRPKTRVGEWVFYRHYGDTIETYSKLLKSYKKKAEQWEAYSVYIKRHWGEETPIPSLEELLMFPEIKFKSFKEARKAVGKAKMFLDRLVMQDVYLKFDSQKRKEWIQEIISNAPENCDLVSIKGNYKPFDKHKSRYERAVAEHRPCVVPIVFSTIWVAFDPREEVDMAYWYMYKDESSVEYITSTNN